MILIGIGSNLPSESFGSPMKNCTEAVKILKSKILIEDISSWYESEPIPKSDQPWYVNGVLNINTDLNPLAVLNLLHKIESDFGRIRGKKNESRILDLDLLTFNDLIIDTKKLIIPHPRMHLRSFVMKPIVDINPNWIHPKLEINSKNIMKRIEKGQRIKKIKNND
jgi:2-amino-4-hydroxy-6-hydroxymethyldihydropteridine diphosphokinase